MSHVPRQYSEPDSAHAARRADLRPGRAWFSRAATDQARQACRQLALGDATLKATIKQQPTRVEHVQLGSEQFILKRFGVGGWVQAAMCLLRQSRAWREWRNAHRLDRAGVRICLPLALIDQRHDRPRQQWLVLPFVQGPTLNDWLGAAPPPGQWSHAYRRQRINLACLIGEQIGQMLGAGIINRDTKPSNMILDERCLAGHAMPMLIDPAGLRRRRSERQVHRMLAVLDRAAARVGTVTRGEQLVCLKAVLAKDSGLAGPGSMGERLRRVARAVARQRARRPDSYTPD